MLNLIVAISSNYAIGKSGDLLCHLPNDLKHFKAITTGATVVMGKPTFFSLPRHPLPNRRNIVLTRDTSFTFDNTEVAHSIDDLMEMVSAEENVSMRSSSTVWTNSTSHISITLGTMQIPSSRRLIPISGYAPARSITNQTTNTYTHTLSPNIPSANRAIG